MSFVVVPMAGQEAPSKAAIKNEAEMVSSLAAKIALFYANNSPASRIHCAMGSPRGHARSAAA